MLVRSFAKTKQNITGGARHPNDKHDVMILFWYIKNSITHSCPVMKFQDQTMNVNVERHDHYTLHVTSYTSSFIPFVCSFVCSPTNSSIHQSLRSSIHPLIHPFRFIRLFIQFILVSQSVSQSVMQSVILQSFNQSTCRVSFFLSPFLIFFIQNKTTERTI